MQIYQGILKDNTWHAKRTSDPGWSQVSSEDTDELRHYGRVFIDIL